MEKKFILVDLEDLKIGRKTLENWLGALEAVFNKIGTGVISV